ncbi:16S rRNA (uracil(1498)-N(3))-methyltransferase [Kordiimonas lacus]|uniref:Ribosomal RNA small subunit methyltransferase E n=1 Tax=Kordiimonas lacus TaxID=637679 RepID=A0A1G7B7X8_9PROT|nr:16S rRNA (uracil(1498)-N(3))-methyltransferase [Kordiimonas lacus]SDE22940.1 16S rRNA (uracil1498-N3)-methyltransferase [Kordiimonas lacus]
MSKKIQHRLYVDAALPGDGSLTLGPDQSHYLANVMRARTGDQVALFNGRDGEWASEIAAVQKKAVTLRLESRIREQRTEPDLWLAFAPIKKARLDFMAQKATELGVSHMVPMLTRRTIVDRVKTDRLFANAVEAAEQCERLNVPTIGEPVKLEKLIADWPMDRKIMFCDEDLTGTPAHVALQAADNKSNPRPWGILIGPEGGFDDHERALIRSHPNTVVVALGPRVLRADTAAMSAISLWQSALGDW